MRQLGDFATWLGLILVVAGVVYFTPKLVEYMNDDTISRPRASVASRQSGQLSAKRNMAMHHAGLGRRSHADSN